MWVTLVLGTCVLVIGYLGTHLSLYPPKTDKSKRLSLIAFLVLTASALLLTIWQEVRNYYVQSENTALMEAIQSNTAHTSSAVNKLREEVVDTEEKPKHTHMQIDNPILLPEKAKRIIAGEPISMNVGYRNVGGFAAVRWYFDAQVSLRPLNDGDGAIREFWKSITIPPFSEGNALISPNEKNLHFRTFTGPTPTKETITSLKQGSLVIFVIAVVRWQDESGFWQQNYCRFNVRGGPWHVCPPHNNEEKLE